MSQATTGDVNVTSSSKELSLPDFPGEDFLAHAGTQWLESAEAKLAGKQLLAVAQGHEPPAVKCIVDIDLSELPTLPTSHRDHDRREETRIKVKAQNKANAEKRLNLTLTAWTEIYSAIKACTEVTAPVLSRELYELCDLSVTRGLPGGHFDGPRAWRIVVHRIKGGQRTEEDKDFYRTAERLQRANHLADGCLASDYSKKALAFLMRIKPNLAQSYDKDDTSQYLIGLMPKSLKQAGRQIKYELMAEGKYHDHMHVIQRCRQVVHEEQKAAAPTPTLIVVGSDDLSLHDLDSLAGATGMCLSGGGVSMPAIGTAGAAAGGDVKWCADCPH